MHEGKMISSMINDRTEHADWICPSDRHLSLRAKLKTGWSVRTLKPTGKCKSELLTRNELDQIRNVIKRAERLDIGEQKRVGNMVDSLENMKNKAMGDGRSRCILCAEQFGKIVGASHVVCAECKKKVCCKCSVPHVALNRVRITRHSQKSRQRWICKICDESRELWKKSGAWFFQTMPKYVKEEKSDPSLYILPSSPPPTVAHSVQSARFHSSRLSKKRLSSRSSDVFPANVAYTHRSVYRRRSNSSQSSDDDVTTPPHRRRRGDVSTVSSVSSSSRRKDSSRSSVTSPTSARSYSEESPASLVQTSPDLSTLHSSGVNQLPEVVESHNRDVPVVVPEKGGPQPTVAPLGTIEFTMRYEPQKFALHINIVRARGLRSMDVNGYSDPYVKLHIFPGSRKTGSEATKMRTKTRKRTLNPDFNETLTYWGITETDIERKRLRLLMQDEDTFGHNEFLGEVLVPLRHVEPYQTRAFNVPLEQHQPVKEDEDNERGRMLIALCYEQRNSILVVTIQRCSGLFFAARGHNIDPMIKACLQVDGATPNESTTRKSDRKKATRSPNPVYNEEMRLPLPGGVRDLVKCHLDVSVWDRDSMGRDHLIGCLMFGINSKGDKLQHWFHCVKNPSKQREMWHSLTYPDDPGRVSTLLAAGKRRRTPRLTRKLMIS